MPQQGQSRGNQIQDYITVAERVEAFYRKFPEGRIITHIVEHDAERGFILMRAEVYRNAEDALPAATGHAFELKTEGYVQRTSYIEVCETSCVGRGLAMAGFEVKRGIASREEMEKAARIEREEAARQQPQREQPSREREQPSREREQPQAAAAKPAAPAKANQPATDEQKQEILNLLEDARPGDRRAQRRMLVEMTGKESRDDLAQAEADALITKLRQEAEEGSI